MVVEAYGRTACVCEFFCELRCFVQAQRVVSQLKAAKATEQT
jgi:hypothetical protein